MPRSRLRDKNARARRATRKATAAQSWDVSDWSSESDYAPEADGSEDSDSDEQLASEELFNLDDDSLPAQGAIDENGLSPRDVDQDDICDSIELDDLEDIEEKIAEFQLIDPALTGADTVNDRDRAALFDGNVRPAEFYREAIKTLDLDDYKRKEYAPGTERLIRNTEDQWQTFCLKVLQRKDWKKQLQRLNFQMVYHFLNWWLGQRTGKNGNFKRKVQSKGSLVTFWCCFRLAFERSTNWKIDLQINRNLLHNALAKLGKQYHLTHEKRENRSMTLDDLKLQIETTLRTTEKGFKLGELRILAVLFLLLLAPQGARPQSILDMRFGDLRLYLMRDLRDPSGPARLIVELSMAYTKRYLGPKAEKTFTIPEIMFDPSLLLSPHVFLLAVIFRHRAWASESLNNDVSELSRLAPVQGVEELGLPLKQELNKQYIFRQWDKTSMGFAMSEKPITQGMMSGWVKAIGKILGFKRNTICYNLRYMAGNNLDQHGSVSEALRNLIMDHAPNSDTFQKHYLNRNVCADLWAIHRAQQPQTELIRKATSHGASRDFRRPTKLTQAQLNELKLDSQYVHLSEVLRNMPIGSADRPQTFNDRKALYSRLKADKLKQIREGWDRAQAVEDIERQIHNQGPTPHIPQPVRPTSAAQQRMLDALEAPLVNNLEAQFQRRTDAILAIMAYCDVEEPLGMSNKLMGQREPPPPPEFMRLDPLELAQKFRDSVFGSVGEVQRCFICVAKALTLYPDDPNLGVLTRSFYDRNSLSRHFTSVHLSTIDDDAVGECPICIKPLEHKMHLQSHAEEVHGVRTWGPKKKKKKA